MTQIANRAPRPNQPSQRGVAQSARESLQAPLAPAVGFSAEGR